ncbi:MAG: transcription-repair coupling factor [Lachnospiraceae bacterium]|nr:transcription-repair coupling factor [Candidatus Merdinaster equi]
MLLAPVHEMGEYENIVNVLKRRGKVHLSGLCDAQKMNLLYGLSEGGVKIIATYSEMRARELYEDCRLYEKNVFLFPSKDLIFYEADIHGNEIVRNRLSCLRKLLEEKDVTVILCYDALMSVQIPAKNFLDSLIFIKKGEEISLQSLTRKLVQMGYEKNFQVESHGQFSIRGGIIDIYDMTAEHPVRIELWGDEVDSIRKIDIESQRSLEEIGEVTLYPASEMVLTQERIEEGLKRISEDAEKQIKALRNEFKTEEAYRIQKSVKELKEQLEEYMGLQGSLFVNLESYMCYFYPEAVSLLETIAELSGANDDKFVIALDEPARVEEHALAIETEFRESMISRGEKGYSLSGQMKVISSYKTSIAKVEKYPVVGLSVLDTNLQMLNWDYRNAFNVQSVASYNNSFEALVSDLNKFCKKKYRIILAAANAVRAQRLAEDLRDRDFIASYISDTSRKANEGEIAIIAGSLRKGFTYPDLRFAMLSETDIFTDRKARKKLSYTKVYEGQKVRDFGELKLGDYVVHENHGLGIYRGIEKIEVEKTARDYMKIEYAQGGVLYVLATGLDMIQKYAASDTARKPKLNRLGSGTVEWEKTKEKVRGAVAVVAKDLVALYAARQNQKGYVYGEDTVWQREFEEMFPYEETRDQLRAIDDTKKDMESGRIMDRLICGDVGYGKTEIAIRAAFKAVQENKQVVYLVPTTILAQQHYNTFIQRMKDFPVKVELLSRFKSSAEQKKTIQNLKDGMTDIVIGTHRVLSADVSFKDLGLLIIDEEQRFGVSHKEKIKRLKTNVNVLTLTATPIPRTLHMSLIGIRDMSLLEEAPEERLPIQTYVMDYNEELVREAILREISRNGQVYYVFNRVANIADLTERLRELVPEANITFAHGQMKETELEAIMYDFINGDIDVLVSTTIIETGLDISNVNTMIIHDADTLGLSQLYQLRGRVGRSNRTAYAFLMYRRDKILKEEAEKRLQAIREFTELGSGYKIAMRDLEIRGAGNLLGQEQHGHMAAVGYDMYCKLLSEAVSEEKGETVSGDFATSVELDVDAFIPPEYVVNEMQKLDIYKRIAASTTNEQAEDMRMELTDRFGSIPKSAENLLKIAVLRGQAHRLYITEVKGKGGIIRFTVNSKAPVIVQNIPAFITSFGGNLTFETKGDPAFVLKYKKQDLVEKEEEMLIETTRDALERMNMLYENA